MKTVLILSYILIYIPCSLNAQEKNNINLSSTLSFKDKNNPEEVVFMSVGGGYAVPLGSGDYLKMFTLNINFKVYNHVFIEAGYDGIYPRDYQFRFQNTDDKQFFSKNASHKLHNISELDTDMPFLTGLELWGALAAGSTYSYAGLVGFLDLDVYNRSVLIKAEMGIFNSEDKLTQYLSLGTSFRILNIKRTHKIYTGLGIGKIFAGRPAFIFHTKYLYAYSNKLGLTSGLKFFIGGEDGGFTVKNLFLTIGMQWLH